MPQSEQPEESVQTSESAGFGRLDASAQEAADWLSDMAAHARQGAEALSKVAHEASRNRETAQILEMVSNAYLVWVNQGMRYWGSIAQRHSEYVASLLRRLGAMREDPDCCDAERRALVEDTEAFLREIADLSARESRVLSRDFERLSAELRSKHGDTTPDGDPRRYANVKS